MSNGEDSEHLQDPDFLGDYVSQFTPRDARSLKVAFRSAINANEVIPHLIPDNRVNIPQGYILQNVNRALLQNANINIVQLSQDNYVRTFIKKLHQVVKNSELDIGTSESLTDTLIAHLLHHALNFDQWPLGINLHPRLKFNVGGDASFTAIPEFVVKNQNDILLVVEDKHLGNASLMPTNDYGEPQIAGEIIACGCENVREARTSHDMTVFVARVISTYVTFYRTEIRKEYWDELANGYPQSQSITVRRWPASSDPINGFDLAEPNGRRAVLDAFCRIHIIISQ